MANSEYLCEIPREAGEVKGTCVLGEAIVLACSNGVYMLERSGWDRESGTDIWSCKPVAVCDVENSAYG